MMSKPGGNLSLGLFLFTCVIISIHTNKAPFQVNFVECLINISTFHLDLLLINGNLSAKYSTR